MGKVHSITSSAATSSVGGIVSPSALARCCRRNTADKRGGLDVRPLVHAALQTGARYGELTQLKVVDFNADAGTVAIRRSKSGKPRHVVLTKEGTTFFSRHCAGLVSGELMFRRASGAGWSKSEQARPMRAALRSRGDRAGGLVSHLTPHLGLTRRNEWCAAAGHR